MEACLVVLIVVGLGAVCILAAAFSDSRAANWLAANLRARAIYLEAMAKEQVKQRAAAELKRGKLLEEWNA